MRDDTQEVLDSLAAETSAPGGSSKRSAAMILASLIEERCDLWHDSTMSAFATIGRRSLPVKSKQFRLWSVGVFRAETGKVPNSEAVTNALAAIEATAIFDGKLRTPHVRIGGSNGRIYLHLADDQDTVIEVTAKGWGICDDPPIRFRRSTNALALPLPERGGNLAGLRQIINVGDESQFSLVVGWLMGCFWPGGPYPLLVLTGEQGSSKSTTARVLKCLIDPTAAPIRSEPKEPRDLMIACTNSHIIALDNLSYVPPWLSDALCRLATGGGFSTRELYSDSSEVVFDSKRPMILNGIPDFATRGDLVERSILVRLPSIPEHRRLPERELNARFRDAHPRVLGVILDMVSVGLRDLKTAKPSRLPRMADFAIFAAACLAEDASVFLESYTESQGDGAAASLEESPVARTVIDLMESRDVWTGTMSDLLHELQCRILDPRPKDFPASPNRLSTQLRRASPALRKVHGLAVTETRSSDKSRTRIVTISKRIEPDEPEKPSSASSASSEDHSKYSNPKDLTSNRQSDGPSSDDRPATVRNHPSDDQTPCRTIIGRSKTSPSSDVFRDTTSTNNEFCGDNVSSSDDPDDQNTAQSGRMTKGLFPESCGGTDLSALFH